MDKYIRKIKVNKVLKAIDTDGDGIKDTLAFINEEDKHVSLLLRQTIEDIGVYTDYKEKKIETDFGNFWDTSNDGSGDFGTVVINTGLTNPYGDPNSEDGAETVIDESDLEIIGCMDPNALNYNSGATQPCQGCCDTGTTYTTVFDDDDDENESVAGCYRLSTGCFYEGDLLSFMETYILGVSPTPPLAEIRAKEWCKGIHSSCNTAYPVLPNPFNQTTYCTPNGCGPAQNTGCIAPNNAPCSCCPGPENSHHLLTTLECAASGANCNGDYDNGCGDCGNGNEIFGGFKHKVESCVYPFQLPTGQIVNLPGYNIFWRFYCVPD